MASIPVMTSLSNIFFNEEAALKYLQDEGFIKREMECLECGRPTTFQRAKLLFKCTKKSCRKSVSAKNGTFFDGQRLPFEVPKGHSVDGVWVVGGVEKTEERRVFAVPVEKRDSETLLDVIKKHVKPGSIIHTDLWRGYEGIEEKLGFKHCTVNYSVSFKDPETGIHTNTIEGTWNGYKLLILSRGRTEKGMEERLWEFAWRRANKNNLWAGFLNALREVVYK
ncbi:Transposase, ISXO2-like domain-containing protein [Strongyloides ratti]|uniref:Transposase, ISXO2-like domain-containing protein n=1 Tax=Strongyloides ratti TaxID=34506 RepID=A0A090L2A1_STRRB|nr:Transposase, ISXO2-like domain-containing protein [Strongyloides ratti]CEF63951.1 Transposase, ISXO2-like domain-containing protein [Strongyloides ratti]